MSDDGIPWRLSDAELLREYRSRNDRQYADLLERKAEIASLRAEVARLAAALADEEKCCEVSTEQRDAALRDREAAIAERDARPNITRADARLRLEYRRDVTPASKDEHGAMQRIELALCEHGRVEQAPSAPVSPADECQRDEAGMPDEVRLWIDNCRSIPEFIDKHPASMQAAIIWLADRLDEVTRIANRTNDVDAIIADDEERIERVRTKAGMSSFGQIVWLANRLNEVTRQRDDAVANLSECVDKYSMQSDKAMERLDQLDSVRAERARLEAIVEKMRKVLR